MDREIIQNIYNNYFVNHSSYNLDLIYKAYNSISEKKMSVSNCSTCIQKIKIALQNYLNNN